MKISKDILLWIVFLFFVDQSYSQTAEHNLKKYWYYRERLINDFMVIGDCQGCSLPASQRAVNGGSSMKWGDCTIMLGFYLGVLGTEYKLLSDNGMSTANTVKEIYYALQAFNRLDFTAESMDFGTGLNQNLNSLNGFFVRDDVYNDFLSDHPEICSGKYSQITVGGVLPNENSDYNNINDKVDKEMSHDQVWHLLMGLSLINSFVDNEVNYNNMSFMDGEIGIAQEARNIVHRMITYMKQNNTINWIVTNPVTGNPVDRGSNAVFLSYGAAEAACH